MQKIEHALQKISTMIFHGNNIEALQEIVSLENSGVLTSSDSINTWKALFNQKDYVYYHCENLAIHPVIRTLILKARTLEELGRREEALNTCKIINIEAQKYKKHNATQFEAIIINADVLCNIGNNIESTKLLEQGFALYAAMDGNQQHFHQIYSLTLQYLQGKNLRMLGELDKALGFLEPALIEFRKLTNKLMIGQSFHIIAAIKFYQGEYDQAMIANKESLDIFTELDYKKQIAATFNNMANVLGTRGELDQALEYHHKSLEIKQAINHKVGIGISLNNIGEISWSKNLLEAASYYLDKAQQLFEEIKNDFYLCHVLQTRIELAIEMKDTKKASKLLEKLIQIDSQLQNPNINQKRRLAEAIVLKTSNRIKNRGKAEEILTTLVHEKVSDFEVTYKAISHLVDLLINELRETEDETVLEEIQQLTTLLHRTADDQKSFNILIKVYIIEFKLAILAFDIKKARALLLQAEILAKEKGLHLLEMEVSLEHDKFLAKEREWENEKLRQSASYNQLLDQTQLDESLVHFISSKADVSAEISQEEPILLVIISKSGLSIYSKSFHPDSNNPIKNVDEQLFASFLNAILSFSDEVFSRSLDRARLGDYTLVMQPIENVVMICYVFRGAAYHAIKKVSFFVEKIKNSQNLVNMLKLCIEQPINLSPVKNEFSTIVSSIF